MNPNEPNMQSSPTGRLFRKSAFVTYGIEKRRIDEMYGLFYIVNKKMSLGRLTLRLEWRRRKCFMGRFGGGWQWAVGFKSSGASIIVFLLVMSVSISWRKRS